MTAHEKPLHPRTQRKLTCFKYGHKGFLLRKAYGYHSRVAKLFEKFSLRNTQFKNRIVVSSMCQYSALNGVPNEWHFVHLGSRAVGGAALVMAEATAISPEGRISPGCTGLWNDEQMIAWKKIVHFAKSQGALMGMQLAHAGRKASMDVPWSKQKSIDLDHGGWLPVAPSAIPFDKHYNMPDEMIDSMIEKVLEDFCNATKRVIKAEFDVLEIHAAHGYLLHEFLSPLSNLRTDKYGGSLENRMRLLLEVTTRVRALWPAEKALFVRISATDWMEGGWDIDQSVELCKKLKGLGVDLIDVSSGGLHSKAKIDPSPGYQVPFAAKIKKETGIATGAVGMITAPKQAEEILKKEKADMIFLARELLRDPYWPRRAAEELDATLEAPPQYMRAW
jgi:2,4-dienoyl-CoA reductase-like NADH-dependent reductase (Old Yellow Enzyme family)